MSQQPSRLRRRVAMVPVTALAVLACATPAGAVIGGTPDGARHPYAGAVDGRPVGGPTHSARVS